MFCHINFIIVVTRSVKNFVGIFDGDCIEFIDCFWYIAIFTVLILPIQEHGRCFHFLVSSSISFFKDLKFLSNRSCTSLVIVNPRQFMLFMAIVKGDISLISLSASLFFLCRRATDFFGVDLVSSHITKSVYQL